MNGAILWQGASLIDGAPIVAIAVGLKSKSTNRKTGAMVQTYILRSDMDPVSAVRTGADAGICGNCTHRGHAAGSPSIAARSAKLEPAMIGRTCYVNIGQGPNAVYKAYKRGRYPLVADLAALGHGRTVRLGTYGDPAAVPGLIWLNLTAHAVGHTGYTHQWHVLDGDQRDILRLLCMASVDNVAEMRQAHARGWRTFRVDKSGLIDARATRSATTAGESLCPASKEAGKKLTCEQCLACCGNVGGRRSSIWIPAHGGTAVMANVRRFAGIPIVEGMAR
jgi:hypothetical protein